MTRRTLAIALAAAGGLLVLWFLLLWGPQGGRLKDAEDRRTAADANNSALELRLARLQASQERAPELMAEYDQLRRAVPDDPDLAQFILDANEAATTAGIDFLSIAPGRPSAGTPPVIALTIAVRGEYFAVLDYLQAISDLPRIVVIDALSLTPFEDEAGDGLSVSITARMFTTTVPQAAPAAGATTTTTTVAGGSTTSTTSAGVTVTTNG